MPEINISAAFFVPPVGLKAISKHFSVLLIVVPLTGLFAYKNNIALLVLYHPVLYNNNDENKFAR